MKRKWWLFGLLLALALVFLAPLASPSPDGLERVAEDKGFITKAREPLFKVIPDYLFPGIENEALSTVLAGLLGTIILFGMGYALAWLLRATRQKKGESGGT